jgi:hypothetical protein
MDRQVAPRVVRIALLVGALGAGLAQDARSEETRPFGQLADWLRLSGELRGRVELSHALNKYISWTVFYAHAFGGTVMERFFRGQSNADYAFVELNARF